MVRAAREVVGVVDDCGHRVVAGVADGYGHVVEAHGGAARVGPGVGHPSAEHSKMEGSHREVACRNAPEQWPVWGVAACAGCHISPDLGLHVTRLGQGSALTVEKKQRYVPGARYTPRSFSCVQPFSQQRSSQGHFRNFCLVV